MIFSFRVHTILDKIFISTHPAHLNPYLYKTHSTLTHYLMQPILTHLNTILFKIQSTKSISTQTISRVAYGQPAQIKNNPNSTKTSEIYHKNQPGHLIAPEQTKHHFVHLGYLFIMVQLTVLIWPNCNSAVSQHSKKSTWPGPK